MPVTNLLRDCALFLLGCTLLGAHLADARADSMAQTGPSQSDGQNGTQQARQAIEAGWRAEERIDIVSARGIEVEDLEFHIPGARFVKLHFGKFKLPHDVTVEVSNPSGTERYQYAGSRMDKLTYNPDRGDDGRNQFSAMSISGDTAVLRLIGNLGNIRSVEHRLQVDYYMVGYPESGEGGLSSPMESAAQGTDGGDKSPLPQTQCGSNDRVDAVCWEASHPDEYSSSRAVAKILIDGRTYCTAWRVGSENFVLANEHCIPSQSLLSATEVWFDYERATCGGEVVKQEVKVTGLLLLASDPTLDYALFTVNDFDSISGFGHLGLDVGERAVGEKMFIPQHGGGLPKQIAINSDMNFSGDCEIDDISHWGFAEDSDLGYYCDTRNGSSGSPVILRDNQRVVAIHHLGGCFNSGSKMSLIWPQISDFFDGIIPDGGDGGGNSPPLADFSFSCTELQCDFDASASSDPDGEVVGYGWDFGDGATGSGVAVSHTFAAAGSYEVNLVVEDGEGATDVQVRTVTVELSNADPVAAFSFECTDTACSFDASPSSDSDGVIENYAWDFGDGSSSAGASPVVEHSYAVDGEYLVILTVEDDRGATGQASSTITVTSEPANEAPVADFSFTCAELVCEFDASASHDPDGSIEQYLWTFGASESTESGGPLKEHAYEASGYYTVTLEVTDDLGATATTETTVYVPPVSVVIELSATAHKDKGTKSVSLSWSGASTAQVEVLRDGALLTTIGNDGAYVDSDISNREKALRYQICETAPGTACSEEVTVGW